MADDITVTPGTGKTVAADDVGGKLHQRVKLSVGADGEAADLDSGQATMDLSLPVVIASDQTAVPISAASLPLPTGAATSAKQDTQTGHLATLAGTVAGTEMQVDVLTLPAITGTVTATVANATIASGTITTITNAVAVTNAALSATGPGTEAAALRVTLATDSTGVVSIDDNGGAITVDGAVTVSGTVTATVTGATIASGSVTADTELPAAALLADGAGNPTTPTVGAAALLWNSASWDRAPGTTANGLDVDVTRLPSANLGQQAMAASLSTVPANNITDATYIGDIKFGEELPAGTQVIGLVGASDTVITVTPTCDTNAYASGDLIFDATEVALAVRGNGGHAILQSVTVIDKADQKVAFTLLIANAATDFGTLNSAPDPDDTETATVIGWVPVATTDYVDLGGAAVACVRNVGLLCKAGGSTTSLYVAAVNGTGTPTYGASDLVIQLGFLRS